MVVEDDSRVGYTGTPEPLFRAGRAGPIASRPMESVEVTWDKNLCCFSSWFSSSPRIVACDSMLVHADPTSVPRTAALSSGKKCCAYAQTVQVDLCAAIIVREQQARDCVGICV